MSCAPRHLLLVELQLAVREGNPDSIQILLIINRLKIAPTSLVSHVRIATASKNMTPVRIVCRDGEHSCGNEECVPHAVPNARFHTAPLASHGAKW